MFIDTIHYNTGELPVFTCRECLGEHKAHSEMSHMHKDIEIISVLKGSIRCQTEDYPFDLKKGDICFINHDRLHALYPTDENSSHRILIIGADILKNMSAVYEKYIRIFLEDKSFSHLRFEGNESHAAEINNYISEIEDIKKRSEDGYELEMLSILYKIMWHLYTAYVSGPGPAPVEENQLIQQKMAEYIYEHFSEPVTLDDIAAAGNISRSQCSKLFKQYTNMTPINFLNMHRLEISRDMLRTTNESIARIAMDCGFTDQSYYNRLFKRQYGCTPLEYRKGDQ